ncbi:MAG TPA: DUF1569 domain-containing protein [Ignavibacteria bacterium]|nr:hypothetical protein [Bacteroidota bacterium]HRI84234.1 DUF1569 domain-containing protein [Ignavibacteria bacterium]HRJ99048.1 DUF1569 domain-containing protein [Ignavibacteria bacterium]
MKNIFDAGVTDEIISRINKLTPEDRPQWGKMSAGQMFAHCNVSYEMIYEDRHPAPNAFLKFILKTFIKKKVVGDSPYQHNSRTGPQFVMKHDKNFEEEKKRLIDYINKTRDLGEKYFNGRESISFGKLTTDEWNNMLYKHLDHHLRQFGK